MSRSLFSLIGLMAMAYCVAELNAYSTTTMYCGETYTLPCYNAGYSRAGTLQLSASSLNASSPSNCSVTISVSGSSLLCPGSSFGIYLNIKTVAFHSRDSAVIREYSSSGYSNVVKRLPAGYQPGSSSPQSVAQLLSRYSKFPSFTVDIINTGTISYSYSPLVMDFNVLNEYSFSTGSYCSPLSGYEHDDVICDSTRVNCPSSYSSTPDLNPVYGVMPCHLGGGSIAGIIIGMLFTIVFIAVIVTLLRRRQHRIIHYHTTSAPVQHVGPVVISGVVNPGYGQPQHYQGPPPQYGATTGPAPYPGGGQFMSEPPKQY